VLINGWDCSHPWVQGNKGTQGFHHTVIYEIITNINLPNLKDGSSSTWYKILVIFPSSICAKCLQQIEKILKKCVLKCFFWIILLFMGKKTSKIFNTKKLKNKNKSCSYCMFIVYSLSMMSIPSLVLCFKCPIEIIKISLTCKKWI
jgi:hypothetical protein